MVVRVHSGAVTGGSKAVVVEEGIEVVVRVEELAGVEVGVVSEVGVIADVGGIEAATTAVKGR
jgi:hypothetical protein